MAKKENELAETSILPLKYVDMMEDIFHAILALALLVIGIGAFFFSINTLFPYTTLFRSRKSVV